MPPEWTAHNPAAAAVVAYRLDQTAGQTIPLQVQLVSAAAMDLELKAEDATGDNLTGSVPPFCLQLAGGTPATKIVYLNAPRLTNPEGVQSHDDEWQWYARPSGGDWQPLLKTRHRAYAVLGPPQAPWSTDDPERYVWTDALDFVCVWAEGARDPYTAASRITRCFYAYGEPDSKPRLSYDGVAHYLWCPEPFSKAVFAFSDLLHFLSGAVPTNPSSVDCHDCASAVSTFANAVGAALIQKIIEIPFDQIHTNVIRLIGGEEISMPFGEHELAWGGSASSGDPVWDSCLMVDFDSCPQAPPRLRALHGCPIRPAIGIGVSRPSGNTVGRAETGGSRSGGHYGNRQLLTMRPLPVHKPEALTITVPTKLREFDCLKPSSMAHGGVVRESSRRGSHVLRDDGSARRGDSLDPRVHIDSTAVHPGMGGGPVRNHAPPPLRPAAGELAGATTRACARGTDARRSSAAPTWWSSVRAGRASVRSHQRHSDPDR